MSTLLLCATTTGYQTQAFAEAARRLGHQVVLATDRCHVMENPWGDGAVAWRALDFEPEAGLPPGIDGVVALGDQAALRAAALGLRFHPLEAVRAAIDKQLTRQRFEAAGLRVPQYQLAELGAPGFPCVLKPLNRSASQGVIRADTPQEFDAALARIRRLVGPEPVLAEQFISGHEFALEGVMTHGQLHVVALFDKPDPLDGPYFEESIYLTCPPDNAMIEAAEQAAAALGLTDGAIHAEMRVNAQGVWMLEVAPRPIGGLCARVIPYLAEQLIEHALTGRPPAFYADPAGVMMIPVTREGLYRSVEGVENARAVPGIEDVVITATPGQHFKPWPEGNSYPGFIFARGGDPDSALRRAYACLNFQLATVLPALNAR
ncbi:MAG: ATP-grasp domain-containing protein [Acidobacteria bacterium]|nr:ATP-grasp domain-containing protein [Acidobacteriota bacterium]